MVVAAGGARAVLSSSTQEERRGRAAAALSSIVQRARCWAMVGGPPARERISQKQDEEDKELLTDFKS